MTDLYDRLYNPDPGVENIAVHYFRAAMGDYATGNTTRAEIINYWQLDSEAVADLDVLLGRIDSANNLSKAVFLLELHDVLLITEAGAKYQTKAEFKTRMGL